MMANVRGIIEEKIEAKKVMVFSKSHCCHSVKAKNVFKKFIGKELAVEDYEVWEIDHEANCRELQAELGQMTGATTVSKKYLV